MHVERNAHLICSTQGQKYELDRDKLTTYSKFSQIYGHVYVKMKAVRYVENWKRCVA